MAFAERNNHALVGNLQCDEHHANTDVLAASALADKSTRDIGSLLHRVKYSGTIVQKLVKAMSEKDRFEKLLDDAVRRNDKEKMDEFRRELDANLCVCTVSGGEAEAFRSLSRDWLTIVIAKGTERKWVKSADIAISHVLFRRVADFSLGYYLDSACKECGGTGAMGPQEAYKTCPACKGTKRAELPKMGAYERKLSLDLVDELTSLEQTHAGVATAKLRREK